MATRHPSPEEWADLVRNLLDAPTSTRLRAHVRRCAACRKTLAVYEAMAALGRAEAGCTPPAEALTRALAAFTGSGRTKRSIWTTVAGILTSDSWSQPALAGVRSTGIAERHVTFRSRRFEVDLFLERDSGGGMSVTGQVAHTKDAGVSWIGVPVAILAGRRTVAATTLNAFGEFQVECPSHKGDFRLSIPIASARMRLEIQVPGTTVAERARTSRARRSSRRERT